MRQNVTTQDRRDSEQKDPRWTYGTGGVGGRFGGAYPTGTVHLHQWDTVHDSSVLVTRKVKCRSYRRAVRVLRWHLMGYKV